MNKYTSWRRIGEIDQVTPLQNIFPLTPALLEIEPSLGVNPAYLSWWRSLLDNHWVYTNNAVFAAIFSPLYDTLGKSDRTVLDVQRDRVEGPQRAAVRPSPVLPTGPSAHRSTEIVIRERDPVLEVR